MKEIQTEAVRLKSSAQFSHPTSYPQILIYVFCSRLRQIVLILALFMGVTLAYDSQEPPGNDGLIRKRSMPRKWSLFEPSFERSRKTSDELQRLVYIAA